ncbi:Candidapepsin-9 [Spathaspora sp. JA1]|nr:Candidapepsin-9 [Spathaspora sp. JA1]
MQLSYLVLALLSIPATYAKNVNPLKIDFNIQHGDSRMDLSDSGPPRIEKRQDPDGSFDMVVLNRQTFYVANISIGSNKESVGVLVDTGSSDLWVMGHDLNCSSRSNFKREAKNKVSHLGSGTGVALHNEKRPIPPSNSIDIQLKADSITTETSSSALETPSDKLLEGSATTNTCIALGSFNTVKSRTFVQNHTESFGIQYVDGTSASGIWGYDDVFIGGIKVSNLSFAVADQSSSDIAVLGIGLPGTEITTDKYENLPIKLRNQGTINKALYSIYLGKASDSKGSILFGAIDNAKFLGNLQSHPMENEYSTIPKIRIEIDSIDFENGPKSENVLASTQGVVLDTGSTLSYVYPAVLRALGEALGGTIDASSQSYIIDCNQPKSATLNLKFGNQTIKVPIGDLVINSTTSQCHLGVLVQSYQSEYMLLGDNILRSAYMVVDLDDQEVSLAPVNYTNQENIEIIPSAVPAIRATKPITVNSGSINNSSNNSTTTSGNSIDSSSSSSANSDSNNIIFTLVSIPTIYGKNVNPLKIDFNIQHGDSRMDLSDSGPPRIEKRQDPDGSFNMVLLNQQTFYLANVSIGSNKESVGVLVDTGSSDLWVMGHDLDCLATSNFKREAKNKVDLFGSGTGGSNIYNGKREVLPTSTKPTSVQGKFASITTMTFSFGGFETPSEESFEGNSNSACTVLGSFNTERSKTFVQNNTEVFEIKYADGSSASGIWGYDDVFIGGIKVSNLSFAVADQSSSDVAVLGIGLPGSETATEEYENLPIKLRNQGTINKALYSIYLGKASDSKGSVLFGAIDHEKFVGNLQTHPMDNDYTRIPRIRIEINSMDFENGSKSKNLLSTTDSVVLDTGSTLSYVSAYVFETLGEALGGTLDSSGQVYIIDCNQPKSATLNLKFENQTIRVPIGDLIIRSNTTSECYLGVLAQSYQSSYMLFGDNILRSVYMVVDLDGQEISLAPVNYSDKEDIEIITSTVPANRATTTSSGGRSGSTSTRTSSISNSESDRSDKIRESGASCMKSFSVIGWILVISLTMFV